MHVVIARNNQNRLQALSGDLIAHGGEPVEGHFIFFGFTTVSNVTRDHDSVDRTMLFRKSTGVFHEGVASTCMRVVFRVAFAEAKIECPRYEEVAGACLASRPPRMGPKRAPISRDVALPAQAGCAAVKS
jgi:hypothetical protein